MQVSVYVYENREGMFEAHSLHSCRGGTGTGSVEMQTEFSRRAIKEGRRDSISIKGIMTLTLFDSLSTPVVMFPLPPTSGLWICCHGLQEARSYVMQTKATSLTFHLHRYHVCL